jgi:hypothetical protein
MDQADGGHGTGVPAGGLSGAVGRRQAIQKLAVGGAIVWGLPLISATAHAQAVPSGCVPLTVDWSTFAAGSSFTSTTVGGVGVSVASSFDGGSGAQAGNRTIVAGPQGNLAGNFLRFNQLARTNSGQTITFSFTQPVQDISFVITDIDNASGNWSDRITVNTAGSTFSFPAPSTVIGVGATGNGTGGTTTDGNGGSNTATGAFRNSIDNLNILPADGRGNLALGFTGPITSFSFRFWCGGYSGSNQLINVGNISFLAC